MSSARKKKRKMFWWTEFVTVNGGVGGETENKLLGWRAASSCFLEDQIRSNQNIHGLENFSFWTSLSLPV